MAQGMLAPPKHGFGTPNATEARLRHSKWRKPCLRHRSTASALQMAQAMLASPKHGFGTPNGLVGLRKLCQSFNAFNLAAK